MGLQTFDSTIGWRFVNPQLALKHYPFSMGATAENVAAKWKITREEQDEFAHNSQTKYSEAARNGKFEAEVIPVTVYQRKGGALVVRKDEHLRLSSLGKLATLNPAFKENGTVTAGNSSGINDGAAGCLVVSEQALKDYNLTPLVRIVSIAIAGVDPDCMGIGSGPAGQKALQRAGLTVSDLDLVELNEAFATKSIACIRDLELDPSIVNVNGGAIALGHPLGASGKSDQRYSDP